MKNSEIRRLLERGHPEEDGYQPRGVLVTGGPHSMPTTNGFLRVVHALRDAFDRQAPRLAVTAGAAIVLVAVIVGGLVVSLPSTTRYVGRPMSIGDRAAAARAGGVSSAAIQGWAGGAAAARRVGDDVQLVLLRRETHDTWQAVVVHGQPQLGPQRTSEPRVWAISCADTDPPTSFVYGEAEPGGAPLRLAGPQAAGGTVVNGVFIFVLDRLAIPGTPWSVAEVSGDQVVATGTFSASRYCLSDAPRP